MCLGPSLRIYSGFIVDQLANCPGTCGAEGQDRLWPSWDEIQVVVEVDRACVGADVRLSTEALQRKGRRGLSELV